MQMQYANLDTDVDRTAMAAAATNHAFLRRMYLTLKAGLGAGWGAQFTYDFAGGSYDDAIIFWRPAEDLTFDFGLRKVNVAYEERRSSGDLRSIECSFVPEASVHSLVPRGPSGRAIVAQISMVPPRQCGRVQLFPGEVSSSAERLLGKI
jgi:hypothetical protein